MDHYVAVILGIACAAAGGELFVRGVLGISRWFRIAPGIVGVTLAAFATSSPELSVAVNAALAGNPRIALGNALGGNVVNVALIFALALLVAPVRSSRDSVRRDFPVALLVPVLTVGLAYDGTLSRLDGALMMAVFFLWIVSMVMTPRSEPEAGSGTAAPQGWKTVLACVAGMGLLVTAGGLIVTGAKGLASAHGIDEFIVGALIVAVGTSVPELATTVIAKWRGYDDIGVGTIIGSNIFNGLFIVATAALIHPIPVGIGTTAVALAFGLVAMVAVYPGGGGVIGRSRGVLLLAVYAAYLATLLRIEGA